jgi:UDPglucose 6-dehydrogenase
MDKVAVLGAGYVGLTTAVGLSAFGWPVVCTDVDKEKIESLNKGQVPFYEPGLEEWMAQSMQKGLLTFTPDASIAIRSADVIFVAVGTPSLPDGSVELSDLFAAVSTISEHMTEDKLIVIKSTVPPGTTQRVKEFLGERLAGICSFEVATNPEFLREGSAIADFMRPDRVVIGTDHSAPIERLQRIYQPLIEREVPFIYTNFQTAEMIKYSANSFLAMKVAFINEISRVCDLVGADVLTIARAIGQDPRIGPAYLQPGPGYGGSCLPKDTAAFAHFFRERGMPLPIIEAVMESNRMQHRYAVQKISDYYNTLDGIKLGVLGTAFKGGTSDMRQSPAIPIINQLLQSRAELTLYDPQALDEARQLWGDGCLYAEDEYEAAAGQDGIVIVTDWPSFRQLDLDRVAQALSRKVMFDFRSLYQRAKLEQMGFDYIAIGR